MLLIIIMTILLIHSHHQVDATTDPEVPCYLIADDCNSAMGMIMATIENCCANHNALSYYDLYPTNGTTASCIKCPVCYTTTTDCTQDTTSTVPYTPDECCITMSGVSYKVGSLCSSCPPACYATVSDCSGGITTASTPLDLSDCCDAMNGMSYRKEGVCSRCAVSVVAQDPHFLLPLTNGDQLCFNIQGEPDFPFRLINDKYVQVNGVFVLPAEDESRTISNRTSFLGILGVALRSPVTGKVNAIKVFAQDHSVVIGDNTLIVSNNKQVNLDITESTIISIHTTSLPDVKHKFSWLNINTNLGLSFTVRFYKKHLDLFLTDTSGLTKNAHGLIGQFLTADVKIDHDNMLMKFGDRPPISVKRGSAWPFLGVPDDCWYGYTNDNQGTGVIDGVYTDYIVEHLIPP